MDPLSVMSLFMWHVSTLRGGMYEDSDIPLFVLAIQFMLYWTWVSEDGSPCEKPISTRVWYFMIDEAILNRAVN